MDISLLLPVVSGLGLGLALIAAIGPQNAFVLRQGLLGEHVAVVVALCVASDLLLISAVVAGAGALLEHAPVVTLLLRWAGGLYLGSYAVLAARRALRSADRLEVTRTTGAPRRAIVLTTLALTWLNPHFYVDTVLVLGAVAAAQGADRWAFGAGALLASVLWFTGLGVAARLLRPLFAHAVTWRVLDASVAVVMGMLAVGVLRG